MVTTNEVLRRIYSIHPSIGAWAKTNKPNILWNTHEAARYGIMEYVGPRTSPLVLNSGHIEGLNKDFIMSIIAMNAILAVVDVIYGDGNIFLKDGLLPDGDTDAPSETQAQSAER